MMRLLKPLVAGSTKGLDPVRKVLATSLRRWKALLIPLLGVGLLAVAALLVGGWCYSDALKDGVLVPDRETPKLDLEVTAVDREAITLHVTEDTDMDGDWRKRGLFGLEWEGGYGQVGAIQEFDDQHVVRQYKPVRGTPKVGDRVRLDSFAFAGDPAQAFGLPFEEVRFTSPLGDFPAWFVSGPRDTWMIFVHGRGADREEALRVLPTFARLGFPSLIITYRNDVETPSSPDGFYRYGETEWQDLQGAAEYAIQHGARNLVLVGYSMGGGIVLNFLYQSQISDRVVAAILDAPMLDFDATVDWGARNRFAPGLLMAVAKKIAALRFHVRWDKLDYLKRVGQLRVPILIFHGDADDAIPVDTSDALASARPDIVTYVRVPGAGHVRSWNADPEAYENALRTFLARNY